MSHSKSQEPYTGLCPECGADEGLLSEDNETFLCAECGYYTTELTKQTTRSYQQKFNATSIKPFTLNCSVH
ncbi:MULTISPECIES: hypothetical protein [Vibrio]|jgi:Zn ribbon nucleic-acid-binding protein|uniref:Transcription initiation factor TFIIIB n=2 Tax=Vibrio TaxID=662 RepID=A0A2S9ZQ19_9VIBR|nr:MULTISPECIES: hypothetical protein [Vibrio]AYV24525.1 hypothetical protein ECB94_25070 [Vibrio mediterranei]EDL51950.1 hypothetical protein VSAK1_15317 [Vibrio mediterranei AK1]KFA97757.1 hypothetical protein HW45_10200 [Vibrio sp. ER1A]MCF4174393.1 hypothetical protein [Vibrio sp. McD22-P3]MCG9628469.1 hypothetical protein [Vibrio mediterranei]